MAESIALANNKLTRLSTSTIAILIFFEIVTIALTIKFSYFILGAILTLFFLYLVFQKTEFGLYVLILLHVFVIKSTEELSIFEILFGAVLINILVGWFVQKKYLKHEKIIHSRADFWLSLFLFTCFLSIIPAVVYQFSILKWFRELVPFLILFIFFPIVELVEKKQLRIIIGCLFLLGFYVAINNLIFYKTAISQAEKLWELTAFRQTANEPILMTLLTLSVSLIIYLKKRLIRLILILSAAIFGIALFTTFSRGYWVGAIISLFCVLILASRKEQFRIIGLVLILSVMAVVLVQIFFGNIGKFVFQAVGERITSLGRALTKDISILNRVVETKAAIQYIKKNPIWGYGLGATYRFFPLIPREMPTWYIHNGYLFLIFKLGILGLFSFLAFFFKSIRNGFLVIKSIEDNFIKAVLIGLVACLIAMIPVTVSSPQFIQKDSLLIIVISAGLIEAVRRKTLLFDHS